MARDFLHARPRVPVAAVLGFTLAASLLALCSRANAEPSDGIHNIQHVVMIMQENRSFDSYFGTYPGANGIPADVCVPDPVYGGCVRPYHNNELANVGGPHGHAAAIADINAGKMDGFVASVEEKLGCIPEDPACANECGQSRSCLDAMGYHDAREIPNYWTYAKNYVLQDNMFESTASWSLPEHLYLVSAWSAVCPAGGEEPIRMREQHRQAAGILVLGWVVLSFPEKRRTRGPTSPMRWHTPTSVGDTTSTKDPSPIARTTNH